MLEHRHIRKVRVLELVRPHSMELVLARVHSKELVLVQAHSMVLVLAQVHSMVLVLAQVHSMVLAQVHSRLAQAHSMLAQGHSMTMKPFWLSCVRKDHNYLWNIHAFLEALTRHRQR